MQAPQRSTPSGAGKAQVRQRRTGWAKRVMQVSHTGSAGQCRQMAQGLGMCSPVPMPLALDQALCSQCPSPPIASIYCRLDP